MATVIETRVSPERSFVPTPEYEVRILTGQFDSATYEMDKVTSRLSQENPVPIEAYGVMHRKWVGARTKAWENDKRPDKVKLWAKGRAEAISKLIDLGRFNQSLFDGLRIIGLDIQDPYDLDKEGIETYFSDVFYRDFAGDEEKSVGSLGNVFFDKCLTKGDVKGQGRKVDARKAKKVLEELKETEGVLSPILEGETFTKLWHVVQARIDNGLGKLKPEDVVTPVSDPFKRQLEYFTKQSLVQPVVGAEVRPAAVVTAPEPVTKGHIFMIEGGEDEAIKELNAKLKADTDKSNLRVTFPVDSIRKYLLQSVSGMEVVADGSAQIDKDNEGVINITGTKIKGKDEPIEKALTIDYSLENDERGSIKLVIHRITIEDGTEFLPEAKDMTERGTFKGINDGSIRTLEQDLDPENSEWHPKNISVNKKGIEVEFVNYAPLVPTQEVSPLPPKED